MLAVLDRCGRILGGIDDVVNWLRHFLLFFFLSLPPSLSTRGDFGVSQVPSRLASWFIEQQTQEEFDFLAAEIVETVGRVSLAFA